MGTSSSRKRMRHSPLLPDDLMHLIFSKLEFMDKINFALVCVDWNQLLKAGSAAARHWVVNYCIREKDLTNFSSTCGPISFRRSAVFGRWLAGRAAAIQYVDLNVDFRVLQDFPKALAFLESHLPLLAGALSGQVNVMHLTFNGGCPFASPVLSSPQFLSILCPLVKELHLKCALSVPVTVDQFAAICRLSNLEKLTIKDAFAAPDGLQETTFDVSNLVNLRSLEITGRALKSIPDAISCLQKLERIEFGNASITEVCAGLARMANLRHLSIWCCRSLRIPPTFEGLGNLSYLEIEDCCLPTIPRALSSLSALRTLHLRGNQFQDDPQWWPTSLLRLTQLVEISFADCGIRSLPAHVSALVGLKVLDASCNCLRNLPNELSSLRSLELLDLHGNYLPDVPVSVLSGLTTLKNVVLHQQRQLEGYPVFSITSPLLPVLQPGVELMRLDQDHPWDMMSLVHLGGAMAAVANRSPVPTLIF